MWVYFLIVSFPWDSIFLWGIISFSDWGEQQVLEFSPPQEKNIKRKPCLGTTVDLEWARLKGFMQDYSRNDAAKGSMFIFQRSESRQNKLLCVSRWLFSVQNKE